MSKKIAVITDSSASLSDELLKEYNIFTSYLLIVFGNDYYQEFKEISPEKFAELSAAQEELPTTSQPAIGVTMELYESILAQGYDDIIHITISSGLSGSYQSAVNAAEMVSADKIHVFDSKSVAFPQGALAIKASQLATEGEDVKAIIHALETMQTTMHVSATVKTLENLKKGGRLSNASAVIGSMLQVKPVVSMSAEGKLEAVAKVRTFKKAIAALVDMVREANLDETYEIGVIHVLNPEEGMQLQAMISEIYPSIKIDLIPLSLVVSAHVGEGTLAVTWAKTN